MIIEFLYLIVFSQSVYRDGNDTKTNSKSETRREASRYK